MSVEIDVWCTFEQVLPLRPIQALDGTKLHGYHLYAICRRPNLRITGPAAGADGTIDIAFCCGDEEFTERVPGEFTINADRWPASWVTVAAHGTSQRVRVSDLAAATTTTGQKDVMTWSDARPSLSQALELEVLYVGKSWGSAEESSRQVEDRLRMHEKVVRAFSEAEELDLDVEFRLVVFRLTAAEDQINTVTLGPGPALADSLKTAAAAATTLPARAFVALAEAALINHFKPVMNTHFVKNFPKKQHKSYQETLDAAYTGVGLHLTTFGSLARLWTPETDKRPGGRSFTHSNTWQLPNQGERMKFLSQLPDDE
jgi:hypothetical protein